MIETVFNAGLVTYLEDIESEFGNIPGQRINTLELLGKYISASINEQNPTTLVFICSHNSRRSQFGQAWALAAARYYGIEKIRSFSGGIESTAFSPMAVAAIQRAGFRIENPDGNKDNPRYIVSSGTDYTANIMFSKRHDDPCNPKENFCAIMVCSEADEACPLIPGADARISMTYDDPKVFDGTELESRKYDERCREIARDLFFVFYYVSKRVQYGLWK